MKLFVVPLESYDLRYTEQWNRWFPELLQSAGVEFDYLRVGDADSQQVLLGGDVLDHVRSTRYRAMQVETLLRLIEDGLVQDGDVFFFHTLWFPGLEALAYVRATTQIDFKIAGVLHAGSYDPWDFRSRIGMDSWSKPLETSWLTFVDRVFVASEFHRRMVLGARQIDPAKIFVTGLPFSSAELLRDRQQIMADKHDSIAFPHRPVPEKSPEVVDVLRGRFGDRLVVTRDVTGSKAEYLDVLARSRVCVSDSLQETFGYSMLEAAALGCVPLVPDRLCYREMYPDRYRFTTRAQLLELAARGLKGEFGSLEDLQPLLGWADKSLDRMMRLVLDW